MAGPPLLQIVSRILRRETGVDASLLPGSLEEAVQRRIQESGLEPEDWLRRLVNAATAGYEASGLLSLMGIGHTHLFRHRAVWDLLLQELADHPRERPLDVLHLGVSTGEEAYTAAMHLSTRMALEDLSVLGVDINPVSIGTATRGEYPSRAAEHVPSWAMERYLVPTEGGFLVRDEVRARVRFLTGSLFSVPAQGSFDLVLMRHVLIYFAAEDRTRALSRAASLCREGGLLVLGASEGVEIKEDHRFGVVRDGLPVFRMLHRSLSGRPKAFPPGGPAASGTRHADPSDRRAPPAAISGSGDKEKVAALISALLRGGSRPTLDLDLRGLTDLDTEAAWSLGRGLRLLVHQGTVVTVFAPSARTPREVLAASLVRELARNGLLRWEEP